VEASSQPAPSGTRPRNPRWGCALAAFFALCALALAAAVVLFAGVWRRVARLDAASGLARIRNEVLESDLAGPEKHRVVGDIQDLRELVREGRRAISLFAWTDAEESMRALTRDRSLPPEELALLERELDALRRQLAPATGD
jgi:hypothetical protein